MEKSSIARLQPLDHKSKVESFFPSVRARSADKNRKSMLIEWRATVTSKTALLCAALVLGAHVVHADDGRGLQRGANASDVSLSGVSSGAAMAVQYAVAHSASIVGVGSIAGPAWGCAEGRVSQAINDCMCGRHPVASKIDTARAVASSNNGDIDPLISGKPHALQRSYVFQSNGDGTVVAQAANAGIDFLTSFIGKSPVVDRGNPGDGSNNAGHGIVSPDGIDACIATGNETIYVRRCGTEDNAGKLFLALYGQGSTYDASKRVNNIDASEVWQFDQQRLIDDVKNRVGTIASDRLFFLFPYKSSRRQNLDMAKTGYLYVPPACRPSGSKCRIHIALHGCKQDARNFATTAGYNNWAEHYKVVVIYPALEPEAPLSEAVCQMAPVQPIANSSWVEPNPNGCWDWWGYLDAGWPDEHRYLTKKAPQMQVIERIIAEVTRPVQ
jgi:poly(3-hydroxybutyrate) depolymerase